MINANEKMLKTGDQREPVEKILGVLEGQRFADFYAEDGMFSVYIRVDYPEGHPKHVTKDMVMEQIKRLFNL